MSDTPAYFGYLSSVFSFLYLYIFVPLSIILESYILAAYSINMVWEKESEPQKKFRRGVAVFFPFLMSLYGVLISEIYGISKSLEIPFYLLLTIGLVIGFAFMYWISGIDDDDELFSTLSCFVSSLIFFSILTVFIITRSFVIISFVFGFLFGVCMFVIRYGFRNLDQLKMPKINFEGIKKIRLGKVKNLHKVRSQKKDI